MIIQYCGKYEKYVSAYHCEFFNGGKGCRYYSNARWNRINDLLVDRNRPKQDVHGVIKPFRCSLIG
ncbi:hypothetical protein [Desulforhabdus amnigena]|uniref:Uncharacterized protein n=1 Tax=Desulforhabdus amnigena TaxID=40218 RepID=A0A9W6FRJ8_9BACT|nr:hypothetical protein [Desulforhabdus amnigena]NLJ29661.1 hypothetical protein [Deltaproteobacteria bacterium]GLI33064.1 hypothetical protein DAMNIGENAA_04970 [Desulforhabdus amnigena]